MAEKGEDKAIQSSWEGDRKIIQNRGGFQKYLHRDSENGKPKVSQEGFPNYQVMIRKNMEIVALRN